jgi:P4 family phage/plasmid primase-like protien
VSNPDDFPRLLRLLGRDNDVIRLARGDAHTTFTVTPIPAANIPQAMDALNSNGQWNVWYEVNDSLYAGQGGRSSAEHITRVAALWADLDFKPKPGGLGSLPEAMEVVSDLSSALGYQPAAIVHSGHGIQPYWPVSDGELTEENRNEVATLLKRWGLLVKQFAGNNHGAADSVFDLPRILRVPGSTNYKDAAHPVATSVDFYDSGAVDLAWVAEVLDEYGITSPEAEVSGDVVSVTADWDWAATDCTFASNALYEISTSNPNARHQWALKWSGIIYGMIRNGCVTEGGFYTLRDALADRFKQLLAAEQNTRPFSAREFDNILKQGQRWAEAWSPAKLSEELRRHTHDSDFAELTTQDVFVGGNNTAPLLASVVEPDVPRETNVTSIFSKQAFAPMPTATAGALALNVQADVKSQQRLQIASLTDTGNAERLSMWLRGKFIWVPSLGWFEWDGKRYNPDGGNHVLEAAKDMFVNMRSSAEPDSPQAKWAHRSLMRASINAALELCKSVPHLVVDSLELDSKSYEMNTPDGIVDLYSGSLRKADAQKDFHTHATGQVPQAKPIPKFMNFLSWAMDEPLVPTATALDPFGAFGPQPGGRVEYLQHLFGVAAIGKLRWHVFPIFLGVGSNGKSALLDIMAGCFGQYAAMMPRKFLLESKQEGHPTEIAQLRGVRLAITSEVPPSSRFDEDLVKVLTGETRLRARRMGEDFFEFENTVTLFMAANHLPQVVSGGVSFWRRARKIDFKNQVLARDMNDQLAIELLREEGPGIMQWIIDGASHVLKHGFTDPESVTIATREYQLEEDVIGRFIAENLIDVEGGGVTRDHVYLVYQSWLRRQGQYPVSMTKFTRELAIAKPRSILGSSGVFSNLQMHPSLTDGVWQS